MKKRYSDFWLDRRSRRQLDQTGQLDPMALARAKRSISQFVRILVGRRIPVKYKTEGVSYTDGEEVVIGCDINDQMFDATVGTALHEASHVVKTDFELVREIEHFTPEKVIDAFESKMKYVGSQPNPDLRKVAEENAPAALHKFFNYVEDRRIDKWVFDTSPGYKGYYHSMYEEYWNNEEIGEALKDPEKAREEKFGSYLFRIINFTNPATDLDALDGLRKCWQQLDLYNIERLESSNQAINVAVQMLLTVLEHVDEIEVDDNFQSEMGVGDLEDADLEEAVEKQLEFLEGEVGNALDDDTAQMVEDLQEAGVTEKEVGSTDESVNVGSGKCVVIDKITGGLIQNSDQFDMLTSKVNQQTLDAVSDGIKMGRRLGNKLKVRDERRETKYNRRRKGRIDNRALAELGFEEKIFYNLEIEEFNEAVIHVTIDASGSMSGQKWHQAVQAAVAIAKAGDMISSLRVQVSFRSTCNVGNESRPLAIMAYDSARDPFVRVKKYFPYFKASGTTPEGLIFQAVTDKLVARQRGTDSYFVNLSDGAPHYHNLDGLAYSGNAAYEHTRSQVSKIRRMGIKVISYFIGSGQENPFTRMYGKDARFISVENVAAIAKTMNDKFLEVS